MYPNVLYKNLYCPKHYFSNSYNYTDELRLVGGVETSTTLSGHLEVFINGEWGTVCDDGWDINDADVACRELGYSHAQSYQCCAQYGRGSGRIWLNGVNCSGVEGSLLSCLHRGIGVHSCSHSEDVGVVCYRPGTVYTLINMFKPNYQTIYRATVTLVRMYCIAAAEMLLPCPCRTCEAFWRCEES